MEQPARLPDEIAWGRQSRRRWPVAVVAVAILVAIGYVVVADWTHHQGDDDRDDILGPDQVPSLFGYDGPAAQRLLEGRGLVVRLEPFRDCEVTGRVVASNPPPGTTYERGDPITVYTALPADITCLRDYQDRVTAWQLLDFANGHGAAPAFADRLFVFATDRARAVLRGDRAAHDGVWTGTGVLDALRKASAQVALVSRDPPTYAVPAIRIIRATDELGACGVPDPTVAGTADAFSLLIATPDRTGCPLRLDIYRQADRIEAVALYAPPS
jgi:hypothetical protein